MRWRVGAAGKEGKRYNSKWGEREINPNNHAPKYIKFIFPSTVTQALDEESNHTLFTIVQKITGKCCSDEEDYCHRRYSCHQ